jgi:hypothetical protein
LSFLTNQDYFYSIHQQMCVIELLVALSHFDTILTIFLGGISSDTISTIFLGEINNYMLLLV